jgi:peptide/nickel transport system substrate-binding protein
MVSRIRWQILIAVVSALAIFGWLGALALSAAAELEPLAGEVYVEGVVGAPQQLNPLLHDAETAPAERDLAALIFAGLTRIDEHGAAQPDLAERWTASADARIFTFTLRADRTWHDGRPVTADDVIATIRGVQHADFPGDPALAAFWRNVLLERVDDRTIRFELATPYAPFPAAARLPILPAHLYGDLSPDRWAAARWSRRPIGAGPYRLAAIDATQALLEPHPADESRRFDHLVLRLYPTPDAAARGLAQREAQGVATVLAAGRRAPDPARGTTRVNLPLGEYTVLAFNLSQPPLDDMRFRRALAQGINREVLIANALGRRGEVLDTPVLPGTWAADDTARLPQFRRSEAQQALGELGYGDSNGDGWLDIDGQRLTLPLLIADTPEYVALAQEVARQLRAIGVAIEVRRVPPADLQTALGARNFTLALHRWSNVGDDPDAYALWHSSRAEEGANYAGLRDPRIDQLLADGRAATSESARRRIYGEFQRRWAELIPSLPLYQSVLSYDLDESLAPADDSHRLIITRGDRFGLIEQAP